MVIFVGTFLIFSYMTRNCSKPSPVDEMFFFVVKVCFSTKYVKFTLHFPLKIPRLQNTPTERCYRTTEILISHFLQHATQMQNLIKGYQLSSLNLIPINPQDRLFSFAAFVQEINPHHNKAKASQKEPCSERK